MASMFVAPGGGDKAHHHHHHQISPRNSFKKPWSTNPAAPPPSCGHGNHQVGGAPPKCVCAPATHAGSFKCRLHRRTCYSFALVIYVWWMGDMILYYVRWPLWLKTPCAAASQWKCI